MQAITVTFVVTVTITSIVVSTAASLQCADGFYRTDTGTFCHPCPGNCKTCTQAGYCDICKPGYNGPICKHTCNNCLEERCTKSQCDIGCKEGLYAQEHPLYLGDEIEKYFECEHCPDKCKSCISFNKCTACTVDTFFGENCDLKCEDGNFVNWENICTPCPGNCALCVSDKNCTKCRGDLSGKTCSEPNSCVSISNCISCACSTNDCIPDEYICVVCVDGLYGRRCQFDCNWNCGSSHNNPCNISTGKCLKGCKCGFWSPFCNKTCSSECRGSGCDAVSGHCTSPIGYPGMDCDQAYTVRGRTTTERPTEKPFKDAKSADNNTAVLKGTRVLLSIGFIFTKMVQSLI